MQTFSFTHKTKSAILALGAESAGNFSVYVDGQIHFSDDFGDLLLPENFARYQKELANFLREKKIKPDIILTDLHPDYQTTELGKILAKKYKAKHIQVQHHIAHIFSQILNFTTILNSKLEIRNYFYGIALDGTGYGTDGKIWGGECFKFLMTNDEFRINRIGHLENQIMIGGELAVKEPTRMIISILSKFLSKNKIYNLIKNHSRNHGRELVSNFGKIYSKTEFEILYNQLNQNFNCVETSSTGRILDAVAVLLGFANNERKFKHEAASLLEKNSTIPYKDLHPKITPLAKEGIKGGSSIYILNTTYLFEYLIKNLHKDKKRLAATAQLYLAQGLQEIINLQSATSSTQIILSGGISNNKIISKYFENKKPGSSVEMPGIPRGDAGLSFGQILFQLFAE